MITSTVCTSDRILIVGAGPTGLALAVELFRLGFTADVVDKKKNPSSLSRAVGVLPSSMSLLEPSGVASKIRRAAIGYQAAAFYDEKALIARIPLTDDNDSTSILYGLAQDRTEALLADTLSELGGAVDYDVQLISLHQNENVVNVELVAKSENKSRQYDWVIGTDGVGSKVRSCAGIAFPGFELPEKWSIADVECEDWDTSEFRIFRRRNGDVVVVAPLEANRLRLVSSTVDALQALPVPLVVRRINRQGLFSVAVRQASHYRKGRVLLAGDAAHCHSPVGGRGMNLGIADAADLARRFADNSLDGYHDARHTAGQSTIAISERGRKTMVSKNKIVRIFLHGVLRLLAGSKLFRQRALQNMRQL